MAEVKWIKVIVAARKGKTMQQIKALPDGYKIALFWYEIMQLAGECNENGFLYFEQDFPYTDEMLSVEMGYDETFVKYAIQVFKRYRMVEQIEDVYMLSNWDKYQNVDGLDKIRLQNAKRQSKHRKKLKELQSHEMKEIEHKKGGNVISNVTHNDGVTPSNAIDKEIEEELDINNINNININNKKNYFVDDINLNHAIIEFIDFRKKIKAPMTERAVDLMIKKLDTLSTTKTIEEKIDILDQSILNGWRGIFPLQQNKVKETNNQFVVDENKVDNGLQDMFNNVYQNITGGSHGK